MIEALESRFMLADTQVYLTRPPTRASENGPTIRAFHIWTTVPNEQEGLVVHFTIGGTATNGVDYGKIGSEVTIPAGQSQVQIKVRPFDDTKVEKVESCTLTLNP